MYNGQALHRSGHHREDEHLSNDASEPFYRDLAVEESSSSVEDVRHAHNFVFPDRRVRDRRNSTSAKSSHSSILASIMARPRTNSASTRLPLYEPSSSAGLGRNREPPRLRNGSPPKTRRKHSTNMMLYQLRYGSAAWMWRIPRSVRQACWWVAVLALASIVLFFWVYEPHVELAFYKRSWVASEVLPVAPLSGCFDPSRSSPHYNLSQVRSPKRAVLHAGLPMQLGLDCYDFAGTLQPTPRHPPEPGEEVERVNFHTYWRADLVPFAERQEWMVKSFFATQDLARSRLILWSNGDLRSNEMVRRWARKYPEAFQLKIVDVESLAKGTALDGSDLLYVKDRKAWVDGDLVRLLVTWAYGGVWVDMDSLLTRDLSPLLEHEFVTQWDCYDKIYQPMNGAVMHFRKHSPYLCEAFEIMARSPPPKSGTTEWGSLLYFRLWRRLVAAGIPPFQVLPFCFTDGRSCRLDNRLPDPFSRDKSHWAGARGMHEGSALDSALGKIFSVHLHNQWHKAFPPGGWVERLLLKRYDRALGIDSGLYVQPREEKPFAVIKDHN